MTCFWSSPGGVGGGVQQATLPGQGALQYIYMKKKEEVVQQAALPGQGNLHYIYI